MTKTLTAQDIRDAVKSTTEDIISDLGTDPETDRETLIERMDEECDSMFGQLVRHGQIGQYDVDDLVDTAQQCAAIIHVAEEDAWVEDDSGLWEGLTYGVLASIAYFSLRNLLYKSLEEAGHDSNEDFPFAKKDDDEE